MIAQDRNDSANAQRAYERIVAQDETVSSIKEAQAETIDALLNAFTNIGPGFRQKSCHKIR